MNKYFFITVLFICFFCCANAQQKKYVYQDSTLIENIEEPKVVEEIITKDDNLTSESDYANDDFIDTTLYYNSLKNNLDSVNVIKKEKAFAYVNNLDSLFKAQQNKKEPPKPTNLNWLFRLFSSGLFTALLWILGIGLIVFILVKLFLSKGIFRRSSTSSNISSASVQEEIIDNQTNFDALISKAEQERNYRLAVRYQYLKSLHKLADNKTVQLSVDKTNYSYVNEIVDENTRNSFANLTLNYEYTWYGEFEIDEAMYTKISYSFKNFNQINN
jgi:hypothetical protein